MKTLYSLLLLCGVINIAQAQTQIPEFYAITQNQGQIEDHDEVLAEAFVPGLKMYLTPKGVSYFLLSKEGEPQRDYLDRIKPESIQIHYTRVDIELKGAMLSKQQLQFANELYLKANYYSNGQQIFEVSNYGAVTVKNVYPGIDWVWKINSQNQLEYDFVVHPGANPSVIRMSYTGAELENNTNKLTIHAGNKTVVEGELKAHSGSDKVSIQYNLNNRTKSVSFQVGAYNSAQDLVIDPPVALQWSNLYGGTFADGFRGVVAGDTNFVYLTGYSTSLNFPVYKPDTTAYFDGILGGSSDAVVLKLDSNQTPLWITYFGGSGVDFGNSIDMDTAGRLYVVGGAAAGFPAVSLTGAYNATFTNNPNAFIARFSPNLQLQWSARVGGSGTDELLKVHVSKTGNIFVGGYTTLKSQFGVLFSDYSASGNIGSNEAFFMQFTPNCNLWWSAFYGGSGEDVITSIATDSMGNFTLTGYTSSANFPVIQASASAYTQGYGGGTDGFVVNFSGNLVRKHSVYYGGAGNDILSDIAVGANGAWIFTGRTNSTNLPLQSSGLSYYQGSNAGGYDAILLRLNNSMVRSWCTYYGGNGNDVGTAIACDAGSRIYLSGFTLSNNFPLDSPLFVNGYYQALNGGLVDGFVAGFSPLGNSFWSTYKGGACYEYPHDLAIPAKRTRLYVAGEGLYDCNLSAPDSASLNLGSGGPAVTDGFCWGFGEGGANSGSLSIPPCMNIVISKLVAPCRNQCNGKIVASVVGSTGPIQWNWSNGSTKDSATGLCAGEVWVQAMDSSGCVAERVVNLNSLTDVTGTVTPRQCLMPPSGGAVVTTSVGGNQPYSYLWSTGQTTSSIQNLTGTWYFVTVTDAIGCTANKSFYVPVVDYVPVHLEVIAPPGCGDTNGILVALNSVNNPVLAEWHAASGAIIGSTDTLWGVGEGYYYITQHACTYNNAYNIGIQVEDSLALATDVVSTPNTYCIQGYGDGSLTIQIDSSYTLDWPLSFQWSTGDTTIIIEYLEADEYELTIADASGCSITNYYWVNAQPDIPLFDTSGISYEEETCDGSWGGVFDIDVNSNSGDIYTHTFNWSDGSTDYYVSGSAGWYTLTVTNYHYCTATISVEIPFADTVSLHAEYNGGCAGIQNDGFAEIIIDQPFGWTYTYDWGIPGISTSTANGLADGFYAVYVWNSQGGAMKTVCFQITDPLPITSNLLVDSDNCQDAEASVNPAGGYAPYSIEWSDGSTSTSQTFTQTDNYFVSVTDDAGCRVVDSFSVAVSNMQVNQTATQILCAGGLAEVSISASSGFEPYTGTGVYYLPQGNYTYQVTDSIGCSEAIAFSIIQPDSLKLFDNSPNISCYGDSVTIVLSASGGVSPYSFIGEGIYTAGSYQVAVVDDNGCTTSRMIAVAQPDELILTADSVSQNCGVGVTVSANVNGGTQPYSYLWSNSAQTSTAIYTVSGTAEVVVTDNNGCISTAQVSFSTSPALNAGYIVSPIFCNGETTLLEITATNGTMPYTGTGNFTIGAGSYEYIVTDNAGCADTISFTLQEPDALQLSYANTPILCNGGTSEITLSATGGFGVYVFSGYGFYPAGAYSVSVMDDYGCTATDVVIISEPDQLQVSANILNQACAAATLQANVIGGTSPYYYEWSNLSQSNVTTYTSAGIADVTVTDNNGCIGTAQIQVTAAPPVQANYVVGSIACYGDSTTLELTATDGTIPYNGTGTFSVAAGSHEYIVTDDVGCADTVSFVLTEPDALVLSYTAGVIDCYGGQTTVTLNATGGTLPYVFEGDGLHSAGDVYVEVTDGNGCFDWDLVNITEPSQLTLSIQPTTPYVCGVDSMEILVSGNGGTPPYTGTGPFVFHTTTLINPVITDANGCTVTGFDTVDVPQPPTQLVISDDSICVGDSVVLYATGSYNFTWYPLGYNTPGFTYLSVNQSMSLMLVGTSADGCVSSDSAFLYVANCFNGVGDLVATNGFRIYPNPANNRLNVEFSYVDDNGYTIRLFAVDGKLIDAYTGTDKVFTLDTYNLMEGVYVLETGQGKVIQRARVVVTH